MKKKGLFYKLIVVLLAVLLVGSYTDVSYAKGKTSLITGEPELTVDSDAYEAPEAVPAITPSMLTAQEHEELLATLFEAEISEVTEAVKKGLVTVTEITQYFIDRIETYNGTYNCFITLMEEQALARAGELDRRISEGKTEGVLLGIPIVVKDNIDVEGVYTTNGKSFADSYIALDDAAIVRKMLNEGAVILGKTNMSIEAQSARYSYSRTVGQTYNAYSKKLTSGGSSGGSAVAVSVNFCYAGLGTDTNSSLRIPAAMNGCVAIRFTSKVLDRDGIVILNSGRDVPGAITRTVKDTALMADVLTDFKNSYYNDLDANALSGVRIGIIKELAYRYGTDSEIKKAFANAQTELKALGAELVEVSFPDVFTYSAQTEAFVEGSNEAFLNAYKAIFKNNNISAVIYPAYNSEPFSSAMTKNGLVANSQAWLNNARPLASAIGVPEISVPIGNHSLGAGIGMEIAALKNQEKLLINLAYSYTEKYDHRTIPKESMDSHFTGQKVTMEDVYNKAYDRLENSSLEAFSKKRSEAMLATVGAFKVIALEEGKMAKMGIDLCLIDESDTEGDKKKMDAESVVTALLIAVGVFGLLLILGNLVEDHFKRDRKKRRKRAGK